MGMVLIVLGGYAGYLLAGWSTQLFGVVTGVTIGALEALQFNLNKRLGSLGRLHTTTSASPGDALNDSSKVAATTAARPQNRMNRTKLTSNHQR